MKKNPGRLIFLMLALRLIVTSGGIHIINADDTSLFVPNQILVKFRKGIDENYKNVLHRKYGTELLEFGGHNT